MTWLIVAILSYFILAITFLVDKYLLVGQISNPKVYTFYVGVAGILILLLIPFVGFSVPAPEQIFLSILAGIFFTCGLFWFYKALHLFEPSRIVPALGGILPIFTFLLIYIFSGGRETPNSWEFLAFFLLVVGSILITYERGKTLSLKGFSIVTIAAFLFSLYFVAMKYVFLGQSFWSGLIWIRIGAFLTALCFLFLFKEVREELFKKKEKKKFSIKTTTIFLLNQASGAGGNFLQSWSIALAPLVYVAFINALQGVQHVFLLILTVLLSLKFPKLLKEQISREVIFQKIIAILFIGTGLAILAIQ